MQLSQIQVPTILLDVNKVKTNIDRMVQKANKLHLRLRPHAKTAQSHHVCRYFRELGVSALTASSLSMAEYFVKDGWKDITVAFPVNTREMATINKLASQIHLNLLAVNAVSLELLVKNLKSPVGVFIKIDVGTHRTGLLPEDDEGIESCLEIINSSTLLSFKGFLAHAGHSYMARGAKEIMAVHEDSTARLRKLKERYRSLYPDLQLSTGDTPTCSVADSWPGIDELRPGNFTFYDLMQVQIGACNMEDIATSLVCPVVAKHADRLEVIVFGGGIHLSKDRMNWNGNEIYGLPVMLTETGWEMPDSTSYVRSLSQEHGVVNCSKDLFDKIEIGGLLGILPVHVCMMVDIAQEYLTTKGEVWKKF